MIFIFQFLAQVGNPVYDNPIDSWYYYIDEKFINLSELVDRINSVLEDFYFFFDTKLLNPDFQLLPGVVIGMGFIIVSVSVVKTILSLGGHSG